MQKWRMMEEENIADLAVEVFGKDEEDLWQNILLVFTSLTTDIRRLKEDRKLKIEVGGANLDEIIFNFIEKLIYLKDAKSLLFKKGKFQIENKKIIVNLFGQKITPDLPVKIDIKALTRHKFKVEKNKYYKITAVFDI